MAKLAAILRGAIADGGYELNKLCMVEYFVRQRGKHRGTSGLRITVLVGQRKQGVIIQQAAELEIGRLLSGMGLEEIGNAIEDLFQKADHKPDSFAHPNNGSVYWFREVPPVK